MLTDVVGKLLDLPRIRLRDPETVWEGDMFSRLWASHVVFSVRIHGHLRAMYLNVRIERLWFNPPFMCFIYLFPYLWAVNGT